MKKSIYYIMVISLTVLTMAIMGPVAYATENDNPLISNENPLEGEKIEILFLDGDNTVVKEPLVYNQIIYIVDRLGNVLKEYSVRHNTTIAMPELEKETGWTFKNWKTYYKGRAFFLEPVYRIDLTIQDSEGNSITKLTCDLGHTVRVVDKHHKELMKVSYNVPTTVRIPAPPTKSGYVFDRWETENKQDEFLMRPLYSVLIYFTDAENILLFDVKFKPGEQYYILDKDKYVIETYTVGETEAIALVPDEIDGLQFYNWCSFMYENEFYVYPSYGEPLEGKQKPPIATHAGKVNLTIKEDEIDSSSYVDEDNGIMYINGVALPIALITWGIPIVIVGIAAIIIIIVKKRKKSKIGGF